MLLYKIHDKLKKFIKTEIKAAAKKSEKIPTSFQEHETNLRVFFIYINV